MSSGSVIDLVRNRGDSVRRIPAALPVFDLARAYDEHGAVLLGYAVNALGDRGLAEDCVQETFLRAWRARSRYDQEKASIRTWLFSIERNVIIDVQRSRQRMPRLVSPDALESTPTDAADSLERLRVLEALAKLTPDHRRVIVDVHLAGTSYAELSAASGVPVATLRTRAFYALKMLRGLLDGKDD